MSEGPRSRWESEEKTRKEKQARVEVKVSDKRRTAAPTPADTPPADPGTEDDMGDVVAEAAVSLEEHKRVLAEFDNYRKRMMREQSEIGRHSTAGLIKKLLPVLDNFERAAAHGADSKSLELLHKELMTVLAAEGLEVIPAEGEPFDPHVHEAVESREQADVEVPTCATVYRTGYRFGGKVLRPAMVGVGRPAEQEASAEDAAS
jgi:molecular chaperone GrpE